MNILVDIGHPAHVHLLKGTIHELRRDGHKVIITAKSIPIIQRLLDNEGLDYISIGRKGKSLVSKVLHQAIFDLKVLRIVRKEKIQIGIGTSISIAHVSRISKMVSINMDDDDDEVQALTVKFSHPFSDVRLTPSAIRGHRASPKAVFYSGTHELAYLHPNRFTPDERVLEKSGLHRGDRYFILRFVAFGAYHDTDQHGLSYEQKKSLVNLLGRYGRVIITSEKQIEPEFEQYRLPVPPEEIHSLMYYSTMFLGDSQTMISEAAIMGVPSFKCNTFAGRLSVPNELEYKYGLCRSFLPEQFDGFLSAVQEALDDNGIKETWEHRRQVFLKDKIDTTAFFVWFIENYPDSVGTMRNTPDFQYRFR